MSSMERTSAQSYESQYLAWRVLYGGRTIMDVELGADRFEGRKRGEVCVLRSSRPPVNISSTLLSPVTQGLSKRAAIASVTNQT